MYSKAPGDFPFIASLDEDQRNAALVEANAAVSAGAGSGKTRVLTARYGWLVMSGRCGVEEILSITFTNKAANEMYSRIYDLLAQYAPVNEYAREAVEHFHRARISTLDSFCAAAARTACRRFGISPDFTSDDQRVRSLARRLALRFVLDKRSNPALQRLIAEKKIRLTAEELFVEPLLRHSPLSRPMNFANFEKIQREEILEAWAVRSRRAAALTADIREKRSGIPQGTPLYEHLTRIFLHETAPPGMEALLLCEENTASLRNAVLSYIVFLSELKNFNLQRIPGKTEAALSIKESIKEIKYGLYQELEALANHALQWDIVKAVFPLLEEFQALLNRKKREMGILTFTDIAHLAVDGLRLYPDIREMYRSSLKAIMIDEFQDNNGLQRELVDLLAVPAGVFYVGDEKQSIYRFRGADVSVFRNLLDQIGLRLSLNRNYRSRPVLIRAFNLIFGGYRDEKDTSPLQAVFSPDPPLPGAEAPPVYEASYRWMQGRDEENPPEGKFLHFAFFDTGRIEGGDNSLKAEDYEAVYIALTIRTMVSRGRSVFDRRSGKARPCTYGDFAVLQRRYTHQHILEKHLKFFGVPFNADRPAGLFNEAPVNDIRAFLKTLVYPDDRIACGTLLRSPFVRLGEEAFTICMLKGKEIFDPALDDELPPPDREIYQEARRRYREIADERDLSVSSLVSRLWYDLGYRYEALWSSSSQVYLDLYDLFFELARTIEDRGQGLIEFLDYLEDLEGGEEKADDSILPGEGESGVHLMSIHRCKGLEFPVVFVYGCGHGENTSLDHRLALFSESRGLSLCLPPAEELPGSGDYFFLAESGEHLKKTEAELKRLLYVAMTRAESELYITAAIPKQSRNEKQQLNPESFESYEEFIVERFEQYRTRDDISSASFLRLLPQLDPEHPLYTIEAVYNYSPAELRQCAAGFGGDSGDNPLDKVLSMEEAAFRAGTEYDGIPGEDFYRPSLRIAAASGLHIKRFFPSAAGAASASSICGDIDSLLEQTGLKSEDFGIIVHAFIEDRFNGRKQRIPPRFAAAMGNEKRSAAARAARTMADIFFDSPLGRRTASADFRKTEYPVLTAVDCGEGRRILVAGKIDLLFNDGNGFCIVDFKTDRDEDISRHAGQLAVYRRAAEDIFGGPVECRLFYLRNGHDADLSAETDQISLEELAAAWTLENT